MSYRVINGQTYYIGNFGQIGNNQYFKTNNITSNNNKESFKNIFDNIKNKDKGFTVSKHAAQRLNEINFNEEDMKQIEKGFDIAKDKNSKNTVMLYKDVALIASVENKTIITAVEKDRVKENIFTNVDSVVIL